MSKGSKDNKNGIDRKYNIAFEYALNIPTITYARLAVRSKVSDFLAITNHPRRIPTINNTTEGTTTAAAISPEVYWPLLEEDEVELVENEANADSQAAKFVVENSAQTILLLF